MLLTSWEAMTIMKDKMALKNCPVATPANNKPVTGTLFDNYSLAGRYRIRPWFYPNQLPAGSHHVRVTLLPDGPDKAAILGQPATTLTADPTFARNVLTASDLILTGPETSR